MSRKGESVTLSLTAEEKAEFERLALQFGCTWGEKPNVSGLLKAIAAGRLSISYSDDIPKPELNRKQAKRAIERIKQGFDDLATTF